jgi:hypothetical protein
MKGLKTVRLGLAGILAAALVAVGAFLVVTQVSAVSGTLSISSPTIAPGGQGQADLRSNVPAPGLGAWTVDITYDPAQVSVASCAPAQGGVCNPNFAATQVRITGASANGLIGDTSLGTITFNMLAATAAACGAPSPLTLTTNVFADATIGDPQPITLTSTTNGTVTCGTAATPLPTLGPTGDGFGGSSSESSFGWLIMGLGGAGLAALAGFGALRLRSKAA